MFSFTTDPAATMVPFPIFAPFNIVLVLFAKADANKKKKLSPEMFSPVHSNQTVIFHCRSMNDTVVSNCYIVSYCGRIAHICMNCAVENKI